MSRDEHSTRTRLIWTHELLYVVTSASKRRPTFDFDSPRVEVVPWPGDALAVWPPDHRLFVHEHLDDAAFSADGSRIAVVDDVSLDTFPHGNEKARDGFYTAKPHDGGYGFRCAVSNDGRRLARSYLTQSYFDGFGSAGDRGWGYDLWELGRKEPLLWEYQWDDDDLVVHPAVSGDGAHCAFAVSTEIVIYASAQPEVEFAMLPLDAQIDALAFSPSSHSIAFMTDAWEIEVRDF